MLFGCKKKKAWSTKMLSRISQREIWNQDKNDKQNPLGEEIRKILPLRSAQRRMGIVFTAINIKNSGTFTLVMVVLRFIIDEGRRKEKTNINRTWSSDGLAPPPSHPFPTVSDHEIQRSELRLLVENFSLSQVLDYANKSFLYCTWEFKIYHLLDFIYRSTTFKVTSNICTFRVWVKRTSSSGFSVKTRTCKQTQQK